MTEITLQEIRDYRERYSIGMLEAKAKLQKQYMLEALKDATTIDELKPIIRRLINC